MRMREHAFSLVELSIVLVILGLLTGGILAGQSLIRASELRAATTEFQRYLTAIHSFRDRYMAIPGDMSNATKFWGVHLNSTDCKTTGSSTMATCDGTGDGNIDESSASPFPQAYERFAFWKHLSNSGLVEGNFTGVAGPDGPRDLVIGSNGPRSRLNNAGWNAGYSLGMANDLDPNWYNAPTGNVMNFGSETGIAANWGAVLKPEEAWNIDAKVDDGRPAFGRIRALKPGPGGTVMPNCTSSATASAAEYNLTYSALGCALAMFVN